MTPIDGMREPHATVQRVAHDSYGKLIALLASRTGDLAAAEDALSEAFASALVHWPKSGCPANPEGWLLTVARRKFVDAERKRRPERDGPDLETAITGAPTLEFEQIPDRRLALMFVCAHPAIEPSIRAPLMLQVVLGLDAKVIASSFLSSPAAMGKRLVRAKEKIRCAGLAFEVPFSNDLSERLDAVLDAIYAAFGEGWSDATASDMARRNLSEEALFLAKLIVDLLPAEPEALGLLALMLHTEARRKARRATTGAYVPLEEQDQTRWDWAMIARAEGLLLRASTVRRPGRYQIEAALQSAHVYRCRTGESNWSAILQLYDLLLTIVPTPVVAVNRALILARVQGVPAGLAALERLSCEPCLRQYQPYWAAQAELLAKNGDHVQAHRSYEIAIGLEREPAVRRFLQERQRELRIGK